MTDSVLLTPLNDSDVIDLGKSFRKQLLPLGSIDYDGKKIVFDKPYLSRLVQSFKDRAYDAVALLMDGPQGHDSGPENMRGQITGVELADDGLYGTIELNDEAAELFRQNPQIGVSCRIVPPQSRADGKQFGHALEHVLATLRPRVTGMKPWQLATNLAMADAPTIDLSNARYSSSTGGPVPENLTLSAEQQTALAAFMASDAFKAVPAPGAPAPVAAPVTPPAVVVPDHLTALRDSLNGLSPEDSAALDALLSSGEEADAEKAGELVGASLALPAEVQHQLDLAAAGREQDRLDLAQLKTDLAKREWELRRREYLAAGVPPSMLNLAEPVMSASKKSTVDLANGTTEDAATVLGKVLDMAKGYIPLSARGTSYVGNDDKDENAPMIEAAVARLAASGIKIKKG